MIDRGVIPSLFTLGNLVCGFVALSFVAEGRYVPAAWLILLAAALDNMDGRLARLIGTDSKFGIEFDSLADVCTFGVVPAFMLYHSLLHSPWGAVAAACFLLVLFVGTGKPAPYRATSVRVDDPAGNAEFRRD